MAENTEVAPPRKRILYVITKASWGGAQRYVLDMAQAAKEAGHEVLVATGGEGTLTERLRERGIAVRSIASLQRDVKLLAEWRSFVALLRIVQEFRPDVIHGNSSKAGALAGLAGRIARVPRIVFTAHGWAFNEARPRSQKAVIAVLHYLTVMLAHTTICVSRALRADAAWMPLVAKRFTIIHNGVEEVLLRTREEARLLLAPDLVSEFPNFLWVGTIAELHPTKGLDTLIEAFAQIAREQPVVLVIMGDGSEWARLQKLTQIYDLPDRIVLTGFVKDAAAYLRSLDVFVLPSRSEALGYALLEAGQAGLASIGTRVGGIPEILEDGETGLLVPSGDKDRLALTLKTLVEDEALRARLGQALHALVRKDFSVREMTETTLSQY